MVTKLVAEGDLLGAAARLSEAGAEERASRLYERACAFDRAADAATRAQRWGDAVRLAVLSGQGPLIRRVSSELVAREPKQRVRHVAETLGSRGEHVHAAPLLEAIGDHERAAESYARAGRVQLAAEAYDRAGQPAPAARVLEAAIRSGTDDDPDALRAQLGELYARHGKHRAAVRVLQQVPTSSPVRARAVAVLAGSLEALGLGQARRDLEEELARHRVEARPSQPRADQGGHDAVLFGRYEIVREVATTPHARLVEATDKLTGERVALKIMASHARGTGRDALQRFVREARALQQLRHPNVVPLRAFVEEGPAMVLAWMGGGSLRELLDREVISPARAAEVCRAVLDALGEAHRLGILHRDIKPSNLLFDEGGTARLADFGAAHMAESNATVTVGAIGTVAYMSPEQRAGKQASVQSDLYGVGVLLYEMLTGELPPSARPVTVQPHHPDLDATHDRVLNQLVAERPADRFASALDARRAIERAAWATRLAKRTITGPLVTEARPTPAADTRCAPPQRGGDRHDSWLGRDVYVLSLERHLPRAAAFARADHPALPTILRADADSQEIWVEVMSGRPLSQGLSLTPAQVDELRSALQTLHRAGGAHGAVDDHHVYVHAGCARLAFPRSQPTAATAEADLAALHGLVG